MEEVREEAEEMEGDSKGAEMFLTDKGQKSSRRLSPRRVLSVREGSGRWCRPSRRKLREEAGSLSTSTKNQVEELSLKSSMLI